MSRKGSARDRINESFAASLDGAFEARFGLKLETGFSFVDMAMVSSRQDEQALTAEQLDWMRAYSAGYQTAMERA